MYAIFGMYSNLFLKVKGVCRISISLSSLYSEAKGMWPIPCPSSRSVLKTRRLPLCPIHLRPKLKWKLELLKGGDGDGFSKGLCNKLLFILDLLTMDYAASIKAHSSAFEDLKCCTTYLGFGPRFCYRKVVLRALASKLERYFDDLSFIYFASIDNTVSPAD